MMKPAFRVQFINILLTAGLCVSACSEPELIKHPNVLFISIDDLNDWVEPLAGNRQSITPNLARFGQKAVNFTQNYCPSPGCNPSRTAVMTGLHPINSGMYSNYQDWRKVPNLKDVPTLGQHFKASGYYTAGAGKIFHYNQIDSLGWDDYYPSLKRPMPNDPFPETTPASMPRFKYMYNMFDWAGLEVADSTMGDYKSVAYISEQLQQEHDKPFFLACGIYRPHLPWYVPQKYIEQFPLDQIQLPKLMEGDTNDLGSVAKELASRGGNYHKHVLIADQWKQAIQGYLASIAFADAMLGNLLEALANSEYAENTIVVIWSDHGWQLGEKKHWRKFALWENVIRTVMMMKVPEGLAALPSGSGNGNTSSLSSLMDIYPTLVDLCNLEPRDDLDGISLKPLLANPEALIDRAILTTYDYGSYSVRYQDMHYIRYIDDSEELYALDKDPDEWHNSADAAPMEEIKNQLIQYLPQTPVDLPENSLIPLQEHHVPPFKSKKYFFSEERKEWMKRFEN